MTTCSVELVLPVLNEERILEQSVTTLVDHLRVNFRHDWVLTVADNGSTDGTAALAQRLTASEPRLRLLQLAKPGRGGALRSAWMASQADIVAYMDVDLSTDLNALSALVEPIADGAADIAIGSRLAEGAQTVRSLRRELISRAYNVIARGALGYPVRDAQCGFKAVDRRVAQRLVPRIVDDGWFFDTELLVAAHRLGLRIHELPVRWTEDTDSRVRIVSTALDDLRGLWRLNRTDDRSVSGAALPARPVVEATPVSALSKSF